MYTVTLSIVRVITAAMEKHYSLTIMSVCLYPCCS